jgi:hypothetical protein
MSEHDVWAESVGAYLLGALEPDEAERFEAHLAGCAVCRRDVEHLKVAADALPMSVPLMRPSPALKGRIMAIVASEAELLAATGRGADTPAPARAPRRRGRLGDWLLRPGVALACALALLITGAAAGVLLSGGGEESTAIATTKPPGSDVRLEVRGDASMLVARRMPAPPPGRIYEVWLKRPGQDGSADVAVPGSMDDVEAVLVTDEPAGGSDTPTRMPVIDVSPA